MVVKGGFGSLEMGGTIMIFDVTIESVVYVREACLFETILVCACVFISSLGSLSRGNHNPILGKVKLFQTPNLLAPPIAHLTQPFLIPHRHQPRSPC